MTIASVNPSRTTKNKLDAVLRDAVELARSAALQDAELAAHVGEHLGMVMVGDRLAAHKFACTMRGYVGWEWTVTVARVPRGRVASVCEVHLLPTEEAILAPVWLPWAERLQPGDIGPGDVLPFKMDDPRLVPGYKATGNLEEDQVAIEELALARARVLSETGRDDAAKRWYEGDNGPRSAGSLQSAGSCGGCGFLVALQGALGQVFGVCSNAWSSDDGKVVALGHGCGAHSETDVPHRASEWPANNPIIDESAIEPVSAEELAAMPVQDSAPSVVSEEPLTEVVDGPSDDAPVEAGAETGVLLAGPSDQSVDSVRVSNRPKRKRKPQRATRDIELPLGEESRGSENAAVDVPATAGEQEAAAITLDLPPLAADQGNKPSREEALQTLDALAQSLPQRNID